MKSDKYHPIDVRYRGPSTAYRGSSHGKPKVATAQPPAKAPAGPWSGAKQDATLAQKAALLAAIRETEKPTRKRPSGLQWFFIALAIYLLLSSLPALQLGSLSVAPTQMQSISDP